MANNQELNKKRAIDEFKKTFYTSYGVKLYIYAPEKKNERIPIGVFHEAALSALHEEHPSYSRVKNLQHRTRFRDYLVYVQVMSYLAHKEGHSKTSIGKFLKRNHATIINSCKMIENGFFSNDQKVLDAHDNTLTHLKKYVGTISEDTESKPDSKPELDPIWYEAKNLLTRGSSKG